ncbi:helix-turn-helix transcriptional regulator [Halorutilales archaeon Cl-col2-1]
MKMSDEELSADERKALRHIEDEGEAYQSQIWKELDISSKKASRIVSKLADAGLVEREEAVYEGNRTYVVRPVRQSLDYSLLMAGDMISPFIGTEEEVDPVSSDAFTQWILELSHEEA